MNKKITIFFILTLVSVSAFSQIAKGRKILGGSIAASFSNNEYKANGNTADAGKMTVIEVSPAFGSFVSDNIVVGAEVLLNSSTQEDSDYKYTVSSVAIGPFFRIYDKSGLFGEVGIAFGSMKEELSANGFGSDSASSSLFAWRVGAGYAIFLNDYAAIEPGISYGISTANRDDVDFRQKILAINIGLTLYID